MSCSACSTFTGEKWIRRRNRSPNTPGATLTTRLVGISCQNGYTRRGAALRPILHCPPRGDCILLAALTPVALPARDLKHPDCRVCHVCRRRWLHASRIGISCCCRDLFAGRSVRHGSAPHRSASNTGGGWDGDFFLLPDASRL